MLNYTRGNWRLEGGNLLDKSSEIVSSDGEIVEPVCIIPHDDVTEEGLEEIKANIALIRSAPKLYEALSDLYNQCLKTGSHLSAMGDAERALLEALNVDNTIN